MGGRQDARQRQRGRGPDVTDAGSAYARGGSGCCPHARRGATPADSAAAGDAATDGSDATAGAQEGSESGDGKAAGGPKSGGGASKS